MKLTCYQVDSNPAPMVPGKPDRDWMDAFSDRHPYRCLPLVVANTTGWELRSPVAFTATWNGGPKCEDIRIDPDDGTPEALLKRWVVSHFSGGILTFHTGYLFRTEPGWDLMVTGPPNAPKDAIAPLTGVVETFWLPFPFTMNWKFTRPGMISFKRGEPFAFLVPTPHEAIDACQPIIKRIEDDPELHKDFAAWGESRTGFLEKLAAKDQDTIKAGWQRDYFTGRTPSGHIVADSHINRRRLHPPRKAEEGE